MNKNSQQSVLFNSIAEKPVCVKFNQPAQTSDAGVVILRSVDEEIQLTQNVADALCDKRQRSKVDHNLLEMVRQRVYGIACGYPDCNDSARIANDPVMKLVCEPDKREDESLASQPTLSRFENAFKSTDVLRAAYAFADTVIATQRQRRRRRMPKKITIDIDPTEDTTYGKQQLTFFNGYYDNYCYLPAMVTIQFDDEPEQYLVGVVLRPGNSKGCNDVIKILRRVVKRLREAFGSVRIVARMDSEFAAPEVFEYLERERMLYLVSLPQNAVLLRLAGRLVEDAKKKSEKSGITERLYDDFQYAANTWEHRRRVVVKAERLVEERREAKDNVRFVVTNLRHSPRGVYKRYCKRGDQENRIKELLNDLRIDLTSCTDFLANQMRCILTASAYALYQELRTRASATEFGRGYTRTLRERLIKVGAVVSKSVRRIVLQLPKAYPWVRSWVKIALACGAESG